MPLEWEVAGGAWAAFLLAFAIVSLSLKGATILAVGALLGFPAVQFMALSSNYYVPLASTGVVGILALGIHASTVTRKAREFGVLMKIGA